MSACRPHGTRAKYSAERCRCEACRAANARYETRRIRRNAYGRSPWVDATRARDHVRSLMASGPGANDGVGYKHIATVTGLSKTTVQVLIYGKNGRPRKRIHRETEAKLLSVTPDDLAAGALVDAGPTLHLVEELTSFGIPKARIARALGAKTPALQLRTKKIRLKTAHAVEKLHWDLWRSSGPFREHCSCALPGDLRTWLDRIG